MRFGDWLRYTLFVLLSLVPMLGGLSSRAHAQSDSIRDMKATQECLNILGQKVIVDGQDGPQTQRAVRSVRNEYDIRMKSISKYCEDITDNALGPYGVNFSLSFQGFKIIVADSNFGRDQAANVPGCKFNVTGAGITFGDNVHNGLLQLNIHEIGWVKYNGSSLKLRFQVAGAQGGAPSNGGGWGGCMVKMSRALEYYRNKP